MTSANKSMQGTPMTNHQLGDSHITRPISELSNDNYLLPDGKTYSSNPAYLDLGPCKNYKTKTIQNRWE